MQGFFCKKILWWTHPMDKARALGPAASIPEEAIRNRSYEIWLRENCPSGRELEHWLQAKAELQAERQQTPADNGIQLGDKSVCFWDYFG